jgi:hypothetical protein
MASEKWPSRVEVEFTEISEQINAIIYDRFSRKVLATFQEPQPKGIMRRIRKARALYGSEVVFPRPWPPRMEKLFKDEIAEARQRMADLALNVADGEVPPKGSDSRRSDPLAGR